MPKAPTHVYAGNPGYLIRLEAHGVVELYPGDELTLTKAEADSAGGDFLAIDKPKTTKPAADAADTKDN